MDFWTQIFERQGSTGVFDSELCETIALNFRMPESGELPDRSDSRWSVTIWSWLQMVAQLDADTMVFVVCGLDGNTSRGLVSCEISPCPNSYDHSRRAKNLRDGAEQLVMPQRWDFLLLRDDGSGVRLHPARSSTMLTLCNVDPPWDPVPPPQKGFGKSDRPGTFERYESVGTEVIWRFDGAKGSHRSDVAEVASDKLGNSARLRAAQAGSRSCGAS